MDAATLNTLYNNNQAANGRDALPPLAHFATPIAADGKVFIGTHGSNREHRDLNLRLVNGIFDPV